MDERTSFETIETSIDEFEALLRSYEMEIPSGSRLEEACLAVKRVVDAAQGRGGMDPREDHRETYRTFAGIFDLVANVLAVKDEPDFEQVIPHLRLLLDPKAGIVQNDRSSPTDAATNKLFELYMALVAMRVGTDLLLDDPDASAGDNPDVMVTAYGERWGLACKVMHSPNPKTYLDRVREGVDQIERSAATHGFVVVALKNVVDHLSLLPVISEGEDSDLSVLHYPSVEAAQYGLLERSPFSPEAFRETLEESELRALADGEIIEGKKAAACALEFLSSTVGVMGELTILRTLHLRPLFNLEVDEQDMPDWRLTREEDAMLHDLNDSIHTQTKGVVFRGRGHASGYAPE
jgi:hypothetical protein